MSHDIQDKQPGPVEERDTNKITKGDVVLFLCASIGILYLFAKLFSFGVWLYQLEDRVRYAESYARSQKEAGYTRLHEEFLETYEWDNGVIRKLK